MRVQPASVVSETLRRRVRGGVDLAVCAGGSLGSAIGLLHLIRGESTETPVTVLIMVALAVVGALGLLGRAPWTPIAYVGMILVTNVVFLMHDGTWVGLGAVYVLTVALACAFISARVAWMVAGILVGTPVLLAVLYSTGILPDAPTMLLDDGANWRRAAVATATALAGIALMSSYAVRQLEQERRNVEHALRRQREERVEQARVDAELAHVRRVESIAELAAEVGADIGAALAVVEARARALTADLHGDDAAECLSDILEATSNAASIMRSLTMLGPETHAAARGNVADAVRALPKLVRRTIPERIAIEVENECDATVAIAAPDLTRVLANLMLNARDAILERGAITVRARCDDAAVLIEVRDTGTGMSPEVQERLFQPFFTTKAVGRGTGLGLATAKVLVDRAGGSITVVSELGHGTTFVIRLPLLA